MSNSDNDNNIYSSKPSSGVPDWAEQSKWFDQRRQQLAKGEMPEQTPQQARQTTERRKPTAPEQERITLKSRPKPQEKKRGTIKQFTSRRRAENDSQEPEYYGADERHQPGSDGLSARRSRTNTASMSADERRRMQAQAMKKRKKRRLTVGVVTAALVVFTLFVVLSLTVLFGIENIEVEGKTRYSADEVIAASTVQLQDNLWLVKSAPVKAGITEKLAYIGSVKITRRLPATLVITVKETTEKYALKYSDNYILLDPSGKVLSRIAREVPQNVYELSGLNFSVANVGQTIVMADGADTNLKTADALLNTAKKSGIEGITSVCVSDGNTLYVIYQGRIKLYVGTTGKLSKKFSLGKGVLDRLDSESTTYTGVLNLSITGKAYFKSGSVDAEVTSAQSYAIEHGTTASPDKTTSASSTTASSSAGTSEKTTAA